MQWQAHALGDHPRWLLGVPFDLLTLRGTSEVMRAAAERGQRLVFATPNVSFLKDAERDGRFHEDILRTQLSVVDGMPIVWLGKLAGVPFPGRVAGSDLLEFLAANPSDRPLRVFFFGGSEGAAEAAMQAVNLRRGGLIAVGALNPGFGDLEQLSRPDILERINRSGADLLVVAVGAARGHRWIEKNRDRLTVPVMGHLGAAMNFISGELQRAPGLFQRLGLEWLWRVAKEPALWRRYAGDFSFLARNLVAFWQVIMHRKFRAPVDCVRLKLSPGDSVAVTVMDCFANEHVEYLESWLQERALPPATNVRLELRNVKYLDSSSLGWVYARLYRNEGQPYRFTLVCDTVSRASLRQWRADVLIAGPADAIGTTR